jgi:DNA-binding response OmpR family regulator
VGAADPIETVYGLGYRLNIASESYHSSPATQSNTPSIKNKGIQKAQSIISRIWDKFQTQYAEQASELVEIVTVLSRKKSDIKLQQQAEEIAHKLAGTLGVFGLMNTSQQAKELEMLLQQTVLDARHIQQATELSKVIQQEISNFPTILEPTTQPNAESTAYSPLLLIVDDDLMLAEQIRIEAMGATAQANINKWNWRVEIATDITVSRKIITQTPPDLILLDLNFPGAGEDGRTLMQELSTRIPRIPVVAFTGRESLKDRVDFACWGGCIFLNKNFPIPVVLQTLTDVLKQVSQTPARRVLIVDNDQTFLQILSNLLTAYGIEVIICANSQEFLQVLTNTQPNLLVLNPQMPVFSGLDLCQVVRTDRKWHNLPVIFISSDTAPEMISQAYTAGADDYLSKSMNKNEIVMRIWQRLQRC